MKSCHIAATLDVGVGPAERSVHPAAPRAKAATPASTRRHLVTVPRVFVAMASPPEISLRHLRPALQDTTHVAI